MKIAIIFFTILMKASQLLAQQQTTIVKSKSNVKNNFEIAKNEWDTSLKGNIMQVFPNKSGFIVLFPNEIIYEVNTEAGIISEADPSILNFTAGTPIGGIIVKGGKNPGGQMRAMNESGESVKTEPKKPKGKGHNFELPDDWSDGNYKLEISIEPNGSDVSNKKVKNGGNVTGVIVVTKANFILQKKGSTFEIQNQSIVNTSKSNTKD